MARRSKSGNVRKRCDCKGWKACTHPWEIEYEETADDGARRRLRGRLVDLTGREPADFAEARAEARRAIVAWQQGRDAHDLLPGDAVTIAALLAGYAARPGATPPRDRTRDVPMTRTVVAGRPFGDWRAGVVTRDMIQAFRALRPTVAGNRDLAQLRAAFQWGILGGLVTATPFKINTVPAVRLSKEEARDRRLEEGEEARLRTVAPRLLDHLITAMLETACRIGELLSMQWRQVYLDAAAPYIQLPAGKTKAKKARRVSIVPALRAVLEARRNDPEGQPLPPAAYVFGDEVGRRRQSIDRAWDLLLLQAHGITPTYRPGTPYTRKDGRVTPRATACLSRECRDELGRINLHKHDLRREAASRWMDSGEFSLGEVSELLGHADVTQTVTYLAVSVGGAAAALQRFADARARVAPAAPADALAAALARIADLETALRVVGNGGEFWTPDGLKRPSTAEGGLENPPKTLKIH